MTPITDAAAVILTQPAPVVIIDTCSLLDLFRQDDKGRPRPLEELQTALALLSRARDRPPGVHLVVPELVPGEYRDNADGLPRLLANLLDAQDAVAGWAASAAGLFGTTYTPSPVGPLGLAARCRRLADELLATAVVLARDRGCLDRALDRVVGKRRPSHAKEIKDSMNLEQAFDLSRTLRAGGFAPRSHFVSSNTRDFAVTTSSPQVHPDLAPDFQAAGLSYAVNLRSVAYQSPLPPAP